MKNTHIVVALALLLLATHARADDKWLGKDKALHFGTSATLAAGGYAASVPFVDSRAKSLLFGGGFAFGLGVAKETWDLAGHGDPSWKDLTWDAIGTVTGLAIAYLVDSLTRTCASPCR